MASNDRHSYVEFYPSDWLAGTAFMPPSAEWLYLQVCLYNWDKNAAMPAAEAALRFSRSPTWEADLATLISAEKVVRTNGGALFVSRAMASAKKAFDLWQKKSLGGKGGKNRKSDNTDGNSPENTDGKSPGKTHRSNENENENENDIDPNGSSAGDAPAGDLVFSVPAEAMSAFREMRRKNGHPLTERAEKMIVKELEKIHARTGHQPGDVLNQSTMLGWRGVFPLKNGDGNGAGNRNGSGQEDGRTGTQRAWDRELGYD